MNDHVPQILHPHICNIQKSSDLFVMSKQQCRVAGRGMESYVICTEIVHAFCSLLREPRSYIPVALKRAQHLIRKILRISAVVPWACRSDITNIQGTI